MVIDSSALLAVIFHEKYSEWAKERLKKNATKLLMGTVNLAEVLIRVQDLKSNEYQRIKEWIFSMGIRFVAPDEEMAVIASEARLKFLINLGDCFAYALAISEGCPILTLDKDFRKTDAQVLLP